MVTMVENPLDKLALPEKKLVLSRTWKEWEVQEIIEISEMLHGPVGIPSVLLIWGLPRGGKTLFMVWLGFKLRKYFGYPTIIDSPYLTPAYGKFDLMLDKDFMVERLKMTKMIELYQKAGRLTELNWEALGIKLYRAAALWDEAYTKMSVHQTADRLSQEYNNQVLQYGHNECVICIVSPDPHQINRQYVEAFVTHTVYCEYHENYMRTGEPYSTYEIRNRTTGERYRRKLSVKKWGKLFKTGGIITPKVSMRKFKKSTNFDLDIEDEQEIENWVSRKRFELHLPQLGEGG